MRGIQPYYWGAAAFSLSCTDLFCSFLASAWCLAASAACLAAFAWAFAAFSSCFYVASAIGRSRDALDHKFQNIDSVLSGPTLAPLNNAVAANIQKLLRYVVRDTLADHAEVFELTNPAAAKSVRDDDRHPVVHGVAD